MKLSRHEENKLVTQGFAAVAFCLAITAAAFYFPHKKTGKLSLEAETMRMVNETMHMDNTTVAKEITFLRENERVIETLWTTLRGWGNGVKLENVDPLITAGVDSHATISPGKIPGNPIEYSGMRLRGERTEFQRLMVALNDIEKRQGLIQVRSAKVQLPENSEPNALRPTFLEMNLEIVAPSSK